MEKSRGCQHHIKRVTLWCNQRLLVMLDFEKKSEVKFASENALQYFIY